MITKAERSALIPAPPHMGVAWLDVNKHPSLTIRRYGILFANIFSDDAAAPAAARARASSCYCHGTSGGCWATIAGGSSPAPLPTLAPWTYWGSGEAGVAGVLAVAGVEGR